MLRRFRILCIKIILYLMFVAAALFTIFNFQIYPRARALVTAAATNKVASAVAVQIAEAAAQEGTTYSDFIRLTCNETGNISAMSVDTVRLNTVRAAILRETIGEIGDSFSVEVSIPIGTILGGITDSGRGRGIPVKILISDAVSCDILSDFEEAGINQTLHRIALELTVRCQALLPFGSFSFTVPSSCPIGETVIVGDVPEAYTKINRLADTVSEQEIDDIYDFGAQLPEK